MTLENPSRKASDSVLPTPLSDQVTKLLSDEPAAKKAPPISKSTKDIQRVLDEMGSPGALYHMEAPRGAHAQIETPKKSLLQNWWNDDRPKKSELPDTTDRFRGTTQQDPRGSHGQSLLDNWWHDGKPKIKE